MTLTGSAALSAPGSKAGWLRWAVLALLREHERSGALPTSDRFLWYELEQRGIVDKTRARGHPGVRRGIDQDVSDALTRLREDGLIPWAAIVDETRTLEVPRYAATVETEALSQPVLTGILTARLDELMPEPLAGVLDRERADREALRELLDGGSS